MKEILAGKVHPDTKVTMGKAGVVAIYYTITAATVGGTLCTLNPDLASGLPW